jgi:hypothetical protein
MALLADQLGAAGVGPRTYCGEPFRAITENARSKTSADCGNFSPMARIAIASDEREDTAIQRGADSPLAAAFDTVVLRRQVRVIEASSVW